MHTLVLKSSRYGSASSFLDTRDIAAFSTKISFSAQKIRYIRLGS